MNEVGINPYTIIEKHNLGIIGVITPDTKGEPSFSLYLAPAPQRFIYHIYLTRAAFPGTSSGAGPGTEFTDPVEAVQKAVDELHAKNITRIIALTHIGYDKDIELAKKTRGVHLVSRLHLQSAAYRIVLFKAKPLDCWWALPHIARELHRHNGSLSHHRPKLGW
jgi:2',3'-cyclic-nucleotide 2'-phosphodiesterase (5'-nucleotidase family)